MRNVCIVRVVLDVQFLLSLCRGLLDTFLNGYYQQLGELNGSGLFLKQGYSIQVKLVCLYQLDVLGALANLSCASYTLCAMTKFCSNPAYS